MNVIEKYIAKQKAILRHTQSITEMIKYLADCKDNGELISESDGQFTGGYYQELWKLDNCYYEFTLFDGSVDDLTIYDAEVYDGKK